MSVTSRARDEWDSRPRRVLRSGRRRVPIWVIVLCGGVGLLALGGGLAFWWHSVANDPRELIVGTWESADQPPAGVLEFRRDGTLVVHPANGGIQTIRYRVLGASTLEIEAPNPGRPPHRPPMADRIGPAIPETVTGTVTIAKLTREELVLDNPIEGVHRFKRGR